MKSLPIVYNRMGIANLYPGKAVQLHEDLRLEEFKPLHDWLLRHELAHDQSDGHSAQDFWHDIRDIVYKPKEISRLYFKFYFTRFFKGAWWQSMPFTIHEERFWVDPTKIWQLGVFVFIIGGLAWLLM